MLFYMVSMRPMLHDIYKTIYDLHHLYDKICYAPHVTRCQYDKLCYAPQVTRCLYASYTMRHMLHDVYGVSYVYAMCICYMMPMWLVILYAHVA